MYNGLSNKCNTLYNNAQNTIEHILNQDGTITEKITGGTHKIRTSGCPGGDINRTDQVPPTALQDRWKLRD